MKAPVLKAIIAEDMAEYIETIEILLNEVAPDVEVAGKATRLEDAELLIEQLRPDVVFMDIQFENEGKTGFDLLESIKQKARFEFQVVFITAHSESKYYSRAFEYKALHFLEKPVNKHKLADAVERVRNTKIELKLTRLASILENDRMEFNKQTDPVKISIEGARFNELVELKNIVFVEAEGRKTNVYLNNDTVIQSLKNFGEQERILSAYPGFIKINRSELINMNYVERYSRKEKLVVLKCQNCNHYISKDLFHIFEKRITKKG